MNFIITAIFTERTAWHLEKGMEIRVIIRVGGDQEHREVVTVTTPDRYNCLFEPGLLNNTRWG